MEELRKMLMEMEPAEAAGHIAAAAKEVFPLLLKEERRDIITRMLGDPDEDKEAGLVHL